MDIFEVLADPTRRRLLARLSHRPCSVSELASAFPNLTQPAISRHLRVLREAGMVEVRRDAQRRIYALRTDCFAQVDDWLADCRAQWLGAEQGHEPVDEVSQPAAPAKR